MNISTIQASLLGSAAQQQMSRDIAKRVWALVSEGLHQHRKLVSMRIRQLQHRASQLQTCSSAAAWRQTRATGLSTQAGSALAEGLDMSLTLIVQPVGAASGCIAQVARVECRWARHLAWPIEGARSDGAIDQVLPLVHGGVPMELQ